MKAFIFILAIGVMLCSCAYDYMGSHGQKKMRDHRTDIMRNQVAQLRVLDTTLFRNGGGVYIQPIMSNRKDVGIYGYNRYSTHFGRVHFFEYRNDSVILISRDNEDSLKTEAERFLQENKFSKRKIKVALKRLKTVYAILSTDSF